MELTEQFIKDNNLTEDQVKNVSDFGKNHTDGLVADAKKEYEGKANADTESILDGVIKYSQKQNNFTLDRNQGEKHGDYLNRYSDAFFASQKTQLEKVKGEYQAKLDNFKGDEDTKQALTDALQKIDDIQKNTADFDKYKEDAGKYGKLVESNTKLKLEVSFGQVKPTFPDTVNEFEAKAKWDEFKNNILKDNEIEIVEGEAIVISKENRHKQTKLKDLVDQDETLTKLLEGRQQGGTGAEQTKKTTIEGVPFEVPEDVRTNPKSRTEAIAKYLVDKGIIQSSTEWRDEFEKFNIIIMKQKTAA